MSPPSSKPEQNAPVPQRLGKYEIVTRLSVGGMAELFLAYATGPGGFRKFVALKKILPAFSEDHEFVRMFLDEARIAAGFSHANIAQVFDLGIEERELYLAIEFIAGKDLRQTMAKAWHDYGLPLGFAARVIRDVCLALHYAHTFTDATGKLAPVIHRDVSPKNVMVGYRGEVKMIDFGIAKARNRLVRTQVGTIKGTPQYMSPEQIHNERLDGRSDQYAAGAILYEMLANRRLFPERDEPSFLANPTDGQPKPLRRLNPDVPEDVAAVVMRALERDPNRRFDSARDMARALETAAGGQLFDDERIARTMATLFAEDLTATRAMLEAAQSGAVEESPTAPISDAALTMARQSAPAPLAGPMDSLDADEDTRVDVLGTTKIRAGERKQEPAELTPAYPIATAPPRPPPEPATDPEPVKAVERPRHPKAANPPATPRDQSAIRELFTHSSTSAVVATRSLAVLAAEVAPGGAALPGRSELEGLCTAAGGTLAWSSADALIATFPRTIQALAAAGRLFEKNTGQGLRAPTARAGIHYADSPIDREDRPMGPPVLTAVRVCELASPGRVFASAPACTVLSYDTPRRKAGRLRPLATSEALGVYELPWRPGQKLKGAGLGVWIAATFAAGVLLAGGAAYFAEGGNDGYPPDAKIVPSDLPVPDPSHGTAAPDAKPPPAAPRPRGTLTLIILPEAEVWLGDRSLGTTPLFNISLPEGTHVLELIGKDGVHRFLSVPIKANKLNPYRMRLVDVPTRP